MTRSWARKPNWWPSTRCDSLDADARKKLATKIKKVSGQTPFLISGVTGEGVRELLFAALETIQGEKPEAAKAGSRRPLQPVG